jgi:hypothetical protein
MGLDLVFSGDSESDSAAGDTASDPAPDGAEDRRPGDGPTHVDQDPSEMDLRIDDASTEAGDGSREPDSDVTADLGDDPDTLFIPDVGSLPDQNCENVGLDLDADVRICFGRVLELESRVILEVVMDNVDPLAGFQFEVHDVRLSQVECPWTDLAQEADFWTGFNAETRLVLGADLTASSPIPAGSGVLTCLWYVLPDSDEPCIAAAIFSDTRGTAFTLDVGPTCEE